MSNPCLALQVCYLGITIKVVVYHPGITIKIATGTFEIHFYIVIDRYVILLMANYPFYLLYSIRAPAVVFTWDAICTVTQTHIHSHSRA